MILPLRKRNTIRDIDLEFCIMSENPTCLTKEDSLEEKD